MRKIKKISAFILMLPVLAILTHNFVPHHHHDFCINELEEFSCETHEESHNNQDQHHDHEGENCNLSHSHPSESHDLDCNIHLVFKVEKVKNNHSINSYIVSEYPIPETKLSVLDYQELISVAPDIFGYYLRGPPIV